MGRDFAKVCALVGGVSICSCSGLLDWSGYTGGRGPSLGDATVVTEDASDTKDATDEVTAASNDDHTSRDPDDAGDATIDVADASGTRDAMTGGDSEGGGSAPSCTARYPDGTPVCLGCCDSSGHCAGGLAWQACGNNATMCMDCNSMGLACVDGGCVPRPKDASAPPACVATACNNLHRCIPFWQGGCCLPPGPDMVSYCGCQIVMPPTPPGIPGGGCF